MAIAKQQVTIQAATVVNPGASTRDAPALTSTPVSLTSYRGGELGIKITNQAGAVGVPLTVIFQTSPLETGGDWYDVQPITGGLLNGAVVSRAVPVAAGSMWGRIIAFGVTNNAATCKAEMQAVVG